MLPGDAGSSGSRAGGTTRVVEVPKISCQVNVDEIMKSHDRNSWTGSVRGLGARRSPLYAGVSSLMQRCATVFLRSHRRTSAGNALLLVRSHVTFVSKSSQNKNRCVAEQMKSDKVKNVPTCGVNIGEFGKFDTSPNLKSIEMDNRRIPN